MITTSSIPPCRASPPHLNIMAMLCQSFQLLQIVTCLLLHGAVSLRLLFSLLSPTPSGSMCGSTCTLAWKPSSCPMTTCLKSQKALALKPVLASCNSSTRKTLLMMKIAMLASWCNVMLQWFFAEVKVAIRLQSAAVLHMGLSISTFVASLHVRRLCGCSCLSLVSRPRWPTWVSSKPTNEVHLLQILCKCQSSAALASVYLGVCSQRLLCTSLCS